MDNLRNFTCEVGAARSGTNFLGEVLSQHPDLAYWRRPKYIWRHGNAWKGDDCLTAGCATPRISRYIHRRFSEYLAASGRRQLLVCTQANVLAVDFVNAVFPEGKIIHIIRDGREVAASQKREWEIHSTLRGNERPPLFTVVRQRVKEVPLLDLPAYLGEFLGVVYNGATRKKYRYSMGPKISNWKQRSRQMDRLEFSALTWKECVSAAREVGKKLPPDRYREVRFEDLVARPEETVTGLLEFMELPPAREVDEFIANKLQRGNAGKWLQRLTPEEMDKIMPHVGDLCRELGYA